MELTFTAEQDAVLEGQRKLYADDGRDFADTTAMVQHVMNGAIESWAPHIVQKGVAEIQEKLKTATKEELAQVEAVLGIVKAEGVEAEGLKAAKS